jgi:heme exporter protein A
VLENLQFHARISGLDAGRELMLAALEEVGLGARADLPARVLSQGQRRRAALARLWLAGSRRLWILDEPFAALDVASVSRLAGLIDARVRDGGMVVLTTHQEVDLPHGRTRRLRLGR